MLLSDRHTIHASHHPSNVKGIVGSSTAKGFTGRDLSGQMLTTSPPSLNLPCLRTQEA
jgi:hypothetical protein